MSEQDWVKEKRTLWVAPFPALVPRTIHTTKRLSVASSGTRRSFMIPQLLFICILIISGNFFGMFENKDFTFENKWITLHDFGLREWISNCAPLVASVGGEWTTRGRSGVELRWINVILVWERKKENSAELHNNPSRILKMKTFSRWIILQHWNKFLHLLTFSLFRILTLSFTCPSKLP